MSFCVVCCHFWDGGTSLGASILNMFREGAVPVFVFVSFYLNYKMFILLDSKKLKKRLNRIAYPLVMWGVIYWLIMNGLVAVFGGTKLGLKDLALQVTLGHVAYLCPQMWFQFNLLVITVVVFLICYLFKNNKIHILVVAALLMICAQYMEINELLWKKFSYEVSFPLGRIMEVFPVAVEGLIFAQNRLQVKMKYERGFWMTISLILEGCVYWEAFTKSPGFGYGGIVYIVHSFSVFVFINMVNVNLIPDIGKRIIRSLAKYSFGVYCVHMLVGRCFNEVLSFTNVLINSFVKCVIIYIVCFFISAVIGKIPYKFASQLVE